MRLDIQGSGVAAKAAIRQHVERRAMLELGRFGDRVDTVRLRVIERPGAPDGRYFCGAAVTLSTHDGAPTHVLARQHDADVYRAIDSVLDRVARQAGGELLRADAERAARERWTTAMTRKEQSR